MSLQDHLLGMLRDWFPVERTGADDFVVRPLAGAPARVVAREADLAEYASITAADGLAALGDVRDDSTGGLAALGLLTVHIMEAIEAPTGARPILLIVEGGVLSIDRTHAPRE